MILMKNSATIIDQFKASLGRRDFPCIGARASLQKDQARFMVAGHMGCPKDDIEILRFLYQFIEEYKADAPGFYSATVIFGQPLQLSEEEFDRLLWQRLQALVMIDRKNYSHDPRVSDDPASPDFAFSLKEEGFFIIGMHPSSNRKSRQAEYPSLVFNPHAQFERMRRQHTFTKMQKIIRDRDEAFSGSVNPMLKNYSESPAVYQYSGRNYDNKWKCPLQTPH